VVLEVLPVLLEVLLLLEELLLDEELPLVELEPLLDELELLEPELLPVELPLVEPHLYLQWPLDEPLEPLELLLELLELDELELLLELVEVPVLVVVEVMLPLVVVVVVEVMLPLVEVEVEPDDEPELLPDELVVVLISTLPPLDELPPKKPPKKPPPKPPPHPPPPITIGWPPPATTSGCCGSSGSGIGIIATCSSQHSVSSMTRRMRLTFLGSTRLAGRSLTYFRGASALVL
jgi:hypothetical protein